MYYVCDMSAEPPSIMTRVLRVTSASVRLGARTGIDTVWRLLKVMVPVMAVMTCLEAFKLLPCVAWLFAPAMKLIGLPGDAALAFITGAAVNLYSAIAVAANVTLTFKQMTILALLCLDCHNLPVECAVQKQAGTGVTVTLVVRFLTGFLGALALFLILPDTGGWTAVATQPAPAPDLTAWQIIQSRSVANGVLLAKVIGIVMGLMILVEFLRQTGLLKVITWLMRPVTWIAGLPREAAVTVMASSTLGLSYGAGLVIAEAKQGHLSREGQFRTNVFIGTTHSVFEDTLLFMVAGASFVWIFFGRLVLGCVAVRVFAVARWFYLKAISKSEIRRKSE
jgi:hypothetical protein